MKRRFKTKNLENIKRQFEAETGVRLQTGKNTGMQRVYFRKYALAFIMAVLVLPVSIYGTKTFRMGSPLGEPRLAAVNVMSEEVPDNNVSQETYPEAPMKEASTNNAVATISDKNVSQETYIEAETPGNSVNSGMDDLKTESKGSSDSDVSVSDSAKEVSGFKISSPFGAENKYINYVHDGIDIVAEEGTKVYSAAAGNVLEAGFDAELGNYIVIGHEMGYKTVYGCLKTIEVKKGDVVEEGFYIGTVGKTGKSTGPHLHFELKEGDKPVNPEDYWK